MTYQETTEATKQAARIIRDTLTIVYEEYAWSKLKAAHDYLWQQVEQPRPMDFPDDLFADALDEIKPHVSSWTNEELARYSRVTGQS